MCVCVSLQLSRHFIKTSLCRVCVAQLKWQFESNRCNFTPHYAVEVTACNVVLIQNYTTPPPVCWWRWPHPQLIPSPCSYLYDLWVGFLTYIHTYIYIFKYINTCIHVYIHTYCSDNVYEFVNIQLYFVLLDFVPFNS